MAVVCVQELGIDFIVHKSLSQQCNDILYFDQDWQIPIVKFLFRPGATEKEPTHASSSHVRCKSVPTPPPPGS